MRTELEIKERAKRLEIALNKFREKYHLSENDISLLRKPSVEERARRLRVQILELFWVLGIDSIESQ